MSRSIQEIQQNHEKPYINNAQNTKFKAVFTYLQCGNIDATCVTVGIPINTMLRWMKEDWWKTAESEITAEKRTKLSTSLQELSNKALEVVHDRLLNGDVFYDQKNSEVVRVPVTAGVASNILKDSIDRVIQIERLKNEETEGVTTEKMADHLAKLAQDFKRFAAAKEIKGEVIDAVPNEGEAGLHEGTGLGTQASGEADPT